MHAGSVALLVLLFIFDGAVSAINAYSAGIVWPERRAAGPFGKAVIWSTEIMAACGFTWMYLGLLTLVGIALGHNHSVAASKDWGWLAHISSWVPALFDIGYLMIIIPILGSGIVIMVHSWTVAYRRRTFGSGALASYNTFANLYNLYGAVQTIPDVIHDLIGFFGGASVHGGSGSKSTSSNANDEEGMVIITMAILALLAGIFTTAAITRWSARRHVQAMCADYNFTGAHARAGRALDERY